MKIFLEKNLAFGNQAKPIPFTELRRRVKARRVAKPLRQVAMDATSFLPTVGKPKVEGLLDEKENVVLRVGNFRLGEHAFPPNVRTKGIKSLGDKSRAFSRALVSEAFLPDHLSLRPLPRPLPPPLRTPPFFRASPFERDPKRGNQATTILRAGRFSVGSGKRCDGRSSPSSYREPRDSME